MHLSACSHASSRLQVTPSTCGRSSSLHSVRLKRQACRCVTIIDFPIIDDPAISIIDRPGNVLCACLRGRQQWKPDVNTTNHPYETPTPGYNNVEWNFTVLIIIITSYRLENRASASCISFNYNATLRNLASWVELYVTFGIFCQIYLAADRRRMPVTACSVLQAWMDK